MEITVPLFNTEVGTELIVPTQLGFDIPTIESLTSESFNMPSGATYEVADDIVLEFTDLEVMEMIANVVCAYPPVLDLQFPNMVAVLNNKIIEMANYDLDLSELIKCNKPINDFLQMTKAGLIVFKSTARNVQFPIKIMFITDKDANSPYYKGTVHGVMFKGIPAIQVFSEETVNSVVNKFYKSHIISSNPYADLLEKVAYKEVNETIESVEFSIEDQLDHLSNVEIASMIISKEIKKSEFMGIQSKLGKSRVKSISMLVQTMREE